MKKLFAATHLLVLFLWAVITSGIHTLRIIIRYGTRPASSLPAPQLVWMSFAPMSEWGASLLASMITLTPGTTAIDIDMVNHKMLLHILDTTDIDAVIADVHATFQPDLVVLFGEPA